MTEQSYWAAITWQEGATEGCLALIRDGAAGPVLLAHQAIPAGHSERYDEYYAPGLQPEPILLTDQPPFVVTARTSNGPGGGGGDLYSIWRPQMDRLVPALNFSLETYTNINTYVETPCPGGIYFYRQQGEMLEITACFDGEVQANQRYTFDGENFVLVPPEPEILQSTQLGPLTASLTNDGLVHLTRAEFSQEIATVVSEDDPDFWIKLPYHLSSEDLDQDGEPEIILIISTPGASCCTTLSVIYFDASSGRYQTTPALYRKYTLGFDLSDLDGDGVTEIRTLNEGFNAALGGASVVSFFSPLQILAYQGGQLVEVTAEYPDLVQVHLDHWLADEELLCTIFGAGSYLAEMHLLEQGTAGWQVISERCELLDEEINLIQNALRDYDYERGGN